MKHTLTRVRVVFRSPGVLVGRLTCPLLTGPSTGSLVHKASVIPPIVYLAVYIHTVQAVLLSVPLQGGNHVTIHSWAEVYGRFTHANNFAKEPDLGKPSTHLDVPVHVCISAHAVLEPALAALRFVRPVIAIEAEVTDQVLVDALFAVGTRKLAVRTERLYFAVSEGDVVNGDVGGVAVTDNALHQDLEGVQFR